MQNHMRVFDLSEQLENFPEVLPVVHFDEAFHVFEYKNLGMLNRNVFKNVIENMSPAFGIVKPLLLPGNAKWLTRKAGDININVWSGGIVPIHNVGIHPGGLMVGTNCLLYVKVIIATRNMLIWHAKIIKGDKWGLQTGAVCPDFNAVRAPVNQRDL